MKMSLADVRVRYQNLMELSRRRVPHKLAYAIAKNVLKLESEYNLIEKQRMEMVNFYAQKDEGGHPVTNGMNYDFGDNAEVFNAEFNGFLDTKTEVDIHTVNSEVLEMLENPRYDVLTGAELIALDFMLTIADCTGGTDTN